MWSTNKVVVVVVVVVVVGYHLGNVCISVIGGGRSMLVDVPVAAGKSDGGT